MSTGLVCHPGAARIDDVQLRRGAYAVAELEQFALDPQVSSALISPHHSHEQYDKDVVERRPSRVGGNRRTPTAYFVLY